MTTISMLEEPPDFSLVMGGPIFQLLRKSHLSGDHLELLHRRLITITTIVWLPLLVLAAGTSGRIAFLRDVEVHARFLVALPVLIAAELLVNSRIRPTIRRFVERRIVLPEDLPLFRRAVESAVRLRNSVPVECGLLILVYTVGLYLWNNRIGVDAATWYAFPGGRSHLTRAGYWYVFVSIPTFQFVLLRWYFRLVVWFRFLWHVSRINLHLVPTHPDRNAGLAFLGKSSYAFAPILFAQGAILAGVIASRVLYRGQPLLSFKLQVAGFIAFFVLVVLGPLLMFTPAMARARRKGLADYGQLAQQYVDGFEQKWVVGGPAPSDELLGTGDIQSLADLGNSYAVVREMRPVPFWLDDITRLILATAAPLAPLLFTIFSPEELLTKVLQVVF